MIVFNKFLCSHIYRFIQYLKDGKENSCRSYSLYYYDLAGWLFLTLAFSGLLSTGWFGIPLAPSYFTDKDIEVIDMIFTTTSILGSVWGVMAYREFTKSKNHVTRALQLCKELDPNIGNYVYSTFNTVSKQHEKGYVPLGSVHFWDPETTAPYWLDKGKYWHILLGLQFYKKDIILKVVSDQELGFFSSKQNVATTSKIPLSKKEKSIRLKLKKKYRYEVCIPQWLVMNTDFNRFLSAKYRLSLTDSQLVNLINSINNQLIYATNEIIEQERQRIRYPWRIGSILVYINKSLPFRILYREILYYLKKYLPRQQKRIIEDVNLKLAYVTNKELINALLLLLSLKGISKESIHKIESLLKFLDNAYKKQGLGDGSNKYHNFHHSLEVAFVGLQLLPKKLDRFEFTEKDYELFTVASLLHDYDPYQEYDVKLSIGLGRAEGPRVERTLNELSKNKIHEAYFLLKSLEFKNYFSEYYSNYLPPLEYSTTHPEYIKYKSNDYLEKAQNNNYDLKPIESIIVEAMILRTDYPFDLKIDSKKRFLETMRYLDSKKLDSDKYEVLSKTLWLADLSVAYMSSDPINAWNRVINLYDELYLPKSVIISKTDQFFSQFAENDLFLNLVNNNQGLSPIFRQRWNLVNQFYHEGNPSTVINRTIISAEKTFSKFNLVIGLIEESSLSNVALHYPNEYFIGIGMDFDVVYNIKNRLSRLEINNASCFWGEVKKLFPEIKNKTIGNLFYLIENLDRESKYEFYKNDLSSIFKYAVNILKQNGKVCIFINSNNKKSTTYPVYKNEENLIIKLEKQIINIANSFNFELVERVDNNIPNFNIFFKNSLQDNINNLSLQFNRIVESKNISNSKL